MTDQGAMPAYPVNTGNEHVGHQTGANTWQFVGMSKREVFAMAAMQGMGAWIPPGDFGPSSFDSRDDICSLKARWAVAQADALLAALSDQPTRQEE